LADSLITTKGIEKTVASGATTTWILRAIDVDIRSGEFVSIMEPSGAGKSTLLHILGLHDADWRGQYVLCGEPVHALSHAKRAELQKQHIGFVFQSYNLIDDLTVAENLEVPLTYRNIRKAQREALVADTLDRFGIVGKKDLFPSQLSGGQQQLVGVARAIIASPTVVLADEPTGNLHSDQAREIMELFRTLNRGGTTIVQVTHSEVNANYGDRVIRLSDGWLVHE
jgi:ABC-type lipoprotein export system ATPase subunit